MQDRLNIHLLLNLRAERQRAHAHARHRAVGDVDRIRTHALGVARPFDLFFGGEGARRVHLDADHELASAQLAQQPCRPDTVLVFHVRRQPHIHLRQFILARHRNSGRVVTGLCGQVGVKRQPHGADVHGRCTTAAAHQARAHPQEIAYVLGKILRAGRIVEPSFHTPREPGVGHGAQRRIRRDLMHHAQRLQHGRRTDRAVDAHHVHASGSQPRDHLVGAFPGQGQPVASEGHRGHDRQVAERLCHLDCRLQFAQVAKRLKEQQVGPSLPQDLDLLLKRLRHSATLHRIFPVDALSNRPHIARNKDRPARHLTHIAHEPHGLEVQLAHLVFQAMLRQPKAVCAKGVAGDHVGPCRRIGLVDAGHPAGPVNHQLL